MNCQKIIDYCKTHKKQLVYLATGLLLLKQVGIIGIVIGLVVFAMFNQEIMNFINQLSF